MSSGLSFLAPHALWLLLALPALVALYAYLITRKKRLVLRYANLGAIKEALGANASLKRHVPAAILFLALMVAGLAVARPAAMVTLPTEKSEVVLALDVSVSMRATDVVPDRMTAARNAAKAFIKDAPSTTRIGIVAFAGSAMLTQEPTLNRQDLMAAVDGLRLQRATNLGAAILTSLQTIFPEMDFNMSLPRYERGSRKTMGTSLDDAPDVRQDPLPPVPPGSYKSAAIILLTDGQATVGPDPIAAARVAADRGVRIFTVGLGSAHGEISGWGGRRMRVQIDEETLKSVADLTKAKYYFANSDTVLNEVYKQLNTQLVMERGKTEISFLFAAVAALLTVIAGGLSLVWHSKIA